MTCAELRVDRDLEGMTRAEAGYFFDHLAACRACQLWVAANAPDSSPEQSRVNRDFLEWLAADPESLSPAARAMIDKSLEGTR